MPAKSRQKFIKSLVILTVLALAFTASPAAAQILRIIPVPPNVKAQWTPIPDLPKVFYAPNIPTDVFRHRGRYYFYWEGVWYQSKNIQGPYTLQQRPPAILSNIQAAYFKTLPRGPAQPPEAEAPGAPPYEGMVTPEGKPMVPPALTTPPSGAYAPPPEPVTPPQPPETAQQPEQESSPPPETEEPAPQAVPEGAMPKAM